MGTTIFTTRMDEALKADLEAIAKYEDRSASYLANQAIEALVEERRATHELLELGLKIADKGIGIEEDEILEWFEAEDDKPFPEAKPFK